MAEKEKYEDVEVTFKIRVLIRENANIDDLLEKETDYIAEPQSTNGCVMSMTIKDIKKI